MTTVYIIGAGASHELELPLGSGLLEIISKSLIFDIMHIQENYIVRDALELFARNKFQSDKHYYKEARYICENVKFSTSIDNFIHQHRSNETIKQISKICIIHSILKAERESKYYPNLSKFSSEGYQELSNTWYIDFFKLISDGADLEILKYRLRNSMFIIFNYDRCFEVFFTEIIKNFYRLDEEEFKEIRECLTIFHPYGTIGSIFPEDKMNFVEYGKIPNHQLIIEASERIKTYNESIDLSDETTKIIGNRLSVTNKFVFLGFGYFKMNMQLLSSISGTITGKKCLGTVKGLSDNDRENVFGELENFMGKGSQIILSNLECNKFFKENWRNLSY